MRPRKYTLSKKLCCLMHIVCESKQNVTWKSEKVLEIMRSIFHSLYKSRGYIYPLLKSAQIFTHVRHKCQIPFFKPSIFKPITTSKKSQIALCSSWGYGLFNGKFISNSINSQTSGFTRLLTIVVFSLYPWPKPCNIWTEKL